MQPWHSEYVGLAFALSFRFRLTPAVTLSLCAFDAVSYLSVYRHHSNSAARFRCRQLWLLPDASFPLWSAILPSLRRSNNSQRRAAYDRYTPKFKRRVASRSKWRPHPVQTPQTQVMSRWVTETMQPWWENTANTITATNSTSFRSCASPAERRSVSIIEPRPHINAPKPEPGPNESALRSCRSRPLALGRR
jgi:hypothetical protein